MVRSEEIHVYRRQTYVIQSAVLNWGNKFEESTCSSVRQLFTYLRSSMKDRRRFNNCFNLHVHKEPAECINLEDAAKEFNDHAANSVHFPPKRMARV